MINMGRIALVSLSVVAIVCATLLHFYIAALIIGVASGVLLFFTGVVGNPGSQAPAKFGSRPGDVTTRIGISLAAAGIAAGALDPSRPFPTSSRSFYGFCLAVACLGALALSAGTGRVKK